MEFLVEFGESRVILSGAFSECNVAFLESIRELLDIPQDQAFVIQRYDPDWGEFINLKVGDVLENKQKLKCLLNASAVNTCSSHEVLTPSSESDNPPTCSSWPPQVLQIPDKIPDIAAIEMNMTDRLKAILKGGKDLDWQLKHEFLQLVGRLLYSTNKLPPRRVKEKMAQLLTTTYPQLKERIGNGWDGWLIKIDNVLKVMRSRDTSYDSKKRKFTSGKELRMVAADVEAQHTTPEDPTVVEKYLEIMKREISKTITIRNHDKIKDLMDATFYHRRSLLTNEESIPMDKLKADYPAFFTVKETENEFKRLMKFDANQRFLENFPVIADKLLEKTNQKKKKSPEINNILIDFERACESTDDTRVHRMVAGLLLLPHLLNEKATGVYMSVEDGNESPDHAVSLHDHVSPAMVVTGSHFTTPLIYLVAEKQVLMECHEFTEAVNTVFCLYYTLNMEYPKSCYKTFTFLQKCVFGIAVEDRVPPSVNTLAQSLK